MKLDIKKSELEVIAIALLFRKDDLEKMIDLELEEEEPSLEYLAVLKDDFKEIEDLAIKLRNFELKELGL